ncbi:MAG: beta-phosphoglucomutase [Chloroflexi bacterium HGW-Chloroflexi-3]|nr:MAG: beta-phosphoglucomutase [Chloroflexi bacterium HGW-Chloroflexi-3]
MIRAFIFDLDGVITDTAEYHFRAWKRLAEDEDLIFTRQDNEALRGVSRRDSLLLLLKGNIYPEGQLQEMMERKNSYYLEFIQDINPNDILPGAIELLQELRSNGYQIALGSASKNARDVLQRLGIEEFFDQISDGYSVEYQKPAPDLFLHAASQLKLSPRVCVVVEDATSGIEAAVAGGFRTIGIGPLERVGIADFVLPDLSGVRLKDILSSL